MFCDNDIIQSNPIIKNLLTGSGQQTGLVKHFSEFSAEETQQWGSVAGSSEVLPNQSAVRFHCVNSFITITLSHTH